MIASIKYVIKKIPPLYFLLKGLNILCKTGFVATYESLMAYFIKKGYKKGFTTKYLLSSKEKKKLLKTHFNQNIKFSILVPLYNTSDFFLKEMLRSVICQTYQNWELCLSDGSEESGNRVQRICKRFAKRDKRIRYNRLVKNEGISSNTNHCIDMATGEFMVLLDHDDLLHPSALHEVAFAINEQNADFVYTDEDTFHITPYDAFQPHYKPDFAPDNLRATNYICHLIAFKATLLEKAGCFRSEFDGSQDHDLVLRLTEQATEIVHIPKILYYWRAHSSSVAASSEAKDYTHEAGRKAIAEHLIRVGLAGTVEDTAVANTHRIRYEVAGEPLISIIIQNKDHKEDIDKCLKSIFELSTYNNYEIVIVENNSILEETFAFYDTLKNNNRIEVIHWDKEFNYSAINNYGAKYANGEYILFLNNDIEIITPDWMQEMLMFAQRADIGAVGAKLYYPDDAIQHAGLILGIGGVAGHAHKYFPRSHFGYMNRLIYSQNVSGVTAACVMMPKEVFEEVNGFNELLEVAFNDVDICMRIRKAGYLIVFTPFAELYHYESKTRGYEDTPEKKARFAGETELCQALWKDVLEKGDPYYNPNLTLEREDFSRADGKSLLFM